MTAPNAIYATLGPAGTNHDLVLRAYLARQNSQAEVLLCPDLDEALHRCAAGSASHMMICAAHPDAGRVVSAAQYAHGIMLVDAFIAESQPLAILTRAGVQTPRSIGLHPATRGYADLTGYDTVYEAPSTVAAFDGLTEGKWDSALAPARFAKDGEFQVVEHIQPPRDAWLILSRDDPNEDVLSL
ncbi:MAG: hypothetical protein AAF557_17980 [Pseudomonadota bacterium]